MTPAFATVLGLGAIALWGLLALFTTATSGIPAFEVTAITFLIGGTLAIIVVALRGRLLLLRQPPMAYALGVGGLFSYHALYFAALKLAPAAEAGLFSYLWPLLLVLLTALLPGEVLKLRHLVGALMGFGGVAALALGKGDIVLDPSRLAGYGLATAAALVWAAYSVLSRRMADVPTDAVAMFCLVTAALAAICHFSFETTTWPLSVGQWLALAALGVGPVGAAFFLWDYGMKQGDIRFLGVASYAAPIISTLALVLAGAATATPALAVACGLIVAGAAIASRR